MSCYIRKVFLSLVDQAYTQHNTTEHRSRYLSNSAPKGFIKEGGITHRPYPPVLDYIHNEKDGRMGAVITPCQISFTTW
jgi:hypothetical protein